MAFPLFGLELKCNSWLNFSFLVALSAFWVNFCLLGVLRSNAVIYSALVDVFEVNRQYAAWPSGVFGFFMSITGAVSGILNNYWSIRSLAIVGTLLASVSVSICSFACQMQHIMLFYGALQGIGIGLIVPLVHVVVNQNFTKYRAFALGIAYSGSSAGSFIFPPISNYLLDIYDLDGTFLLLGGIMLHALLGAMLFKTPKTLELQKQNSEENFVECSTNVSFQPKRKNDRSSNSAIVITKSDRKDIITIRSDINNCENEMADKSNRKVRGFRIFNSFRKRKNVILAIDVLTSPDFLIISTAYAAYFSSSAIFLMVILDFAEDRNVKHSESVFLVSAYSIGDLVGRLGCGWLADLQLIRRSSLVRLYLILMGTLFVILPFLPNTALLAIIVFIGVISGCVIVNHSVLCNEYLGLQKLSMAMGFSTCIVGMTAFLRPIIIGYFRDYHQSYNLLFVFLGLLQISIAAIWFLELIIPFIRRKCVINKSVK